MGGIKAVPSGVLTRRRIAEGTAACLYDAAEQKARVSPKSVSLKEPVVSLRSGGPSARRLE
jgi:hypothetical protein